MNTHDDRKDAKAVNTPMVSAGLKAAEASEIKEELTDDQLAKISGGLNPQPLPPSPPDPELRRM
jgi:bacteriocin-like protein